MFLPAEEAIYSDAGDTIDLSKIGDESNFEIAVGDVRPSRLKVTREELLKNSIDRFDAFGDYEYIGNGKMFYGVSKDNFLATSIQYIDIYIFRHCRSF